MAPRKNVSYEVQEEVIITESPQQKPPMKNWKRFITKRNLIIAAFLILLVGFVYYFMQYQKLSKTSAEISKEKTAQLIKEVSKLAVIPNDPNVQVATVTDINKLKGQAFFSSAQNGDVILIFPEAKEAILYRPSLHKIVSISQLSATPATTTSTAATSPKKNATSTATTSKNR